MHLRPWKALTKYRLAAPALNLNRALDDAKIARSSGAKHLERRLVACAVVRSNRFRQAVELERSRQ